MRLAQKLTAALVVLIMPALWAQAIVDTRRAIERDEARIHNAQEQLGEVLNVSVADIWKAQGWAKALAYLKEVEAQQGDVRVRWVWLEGNGREEYKPQVAAERILRESSEMHSIAFDRTELPGFLVTYKLVRLESLPLGAIELARSTADAEEYVKAETRREVLMTLLVLLVCALVSSVLGRRMVGRPVDALIAHAHRVADGDFSSTSTVAQKDELGRLALALNEMSARLQTAKRRTHRERKARRKVQNQLTHADRLASVGRMTASIIHDVGTPLNVISGRAMMIAEGDLDGDRVGDAARRIAQQAKRIAEMVRDLLTFARRGTTGHARESSVIADLAREVLSIVQPLAVKARVKINVEEGEAANRLTADVNRTQIRQVFMNLTMNAIQAMPTGGEVTVRIDSADADLNQADSVVQITVSDQGVGIPAKKLNRIFEPFFTTKGER